MAFNDDEFNVEEFNGDGTGAGVAPGHVGVPIAARCLSRVGDTYRFWLYVEAAGRYMLDVDAQTLTPWRSFLPGVALTLPAGSSFATVTPRAAELARLPFDR